MIRKTLFWQFFGVHVLLLVAAVGCVACYMWQMSRTTYRQQWLRELEMQAHMAANLLPSAEGTVDEAAVHRFFSRLGNTQGHRFTLILPEGQVIGDTEADPAQLRSHSDRPEVIAALRDGQGMSQRYSYSLGQQMLYLARRIPETGPLVAVIRVAVPSRVIMSERRATRHMIAILLMLVLGVALTLSFVASRKIIGPVADFQQGLQKIGSGSLDYRLPIPAVSHLAELARAINKTAERLQKHLAALNHERTLRTLILENMTHGVIAIDSQKRVLDLNEAARHLLELTYPAAEGNPIGDVLRYPELLKLIDASAGGEKPVETEMALPWGSGGLRLNIRATALNDKGNKRVGTLVVLTDITLLRHLETVRQDFVANVSHELRTPVTSIKGFAEALLDETQKDPEQTAHFLEIIARQANQLESIIHDLLELSRLDENMGKKLERQEIQLKTILTQAVSLCQARADARGATLTIQCASDMRVSVHAGLIEQALVNLIDNAVKYGIGEEAGCVEITARMEGSVVRIDVRDQGPGIEATHLMRLFERFYRADKGRSRALGGTGLGLAIVKHIAMIHDGTVHVESEIGKGSVFTMRLPS